MAINEWDEDRESNITVQNKFILQNPETGEEGLIEYVEDTDIILVDPYLVNIEDLQGPAEGVRVVRLKRPAWGKGKINDAIRVIRKVRNT